ncbi:E3 ubiquitin ligase BIG BROTHER-related isoform X2 [Amborella trichopoda]|nr:E3 ubiquitin ligase BIG BROTHER-related isoform X2 [Amborella trichopoda]|eukprot:XP_020532190.1 E3 ubiquitin ligase BIG BROTHER-related isoform X2 [Amborella trichopoda]
MHSPIFQSSTLFSPLSVFPNLLRSSSMGSNNDGKELNNNGAGEVNSDADFGSPINARVPFTNLSQVESDRAIAKTLQQQERAYMMFKRDRELAEDSLSTSTSYGDGDYEEEEEDSDAEDDDYDDEFDVESHISARREQIDGETNERDIERDEAHDMADRMSALAGINDWEIENLEELSTNYEDTSEDVDPDELSYEELIALGEVVGTQSKGLSSNIISSLPSIVFRPASANDGNLDQ